MTFAASTVKGIVKGCVEEVDSSAAVSRLCCDGKRWAYPQHELFYLAMVLVYFRCGFFSETVHLTIRLHPMVVFRIYSNLECH